MGSMKQKRRKKVKNEWAAFQVLLELTDNDIKLARQTGYPLKRFQDWLVVEGSEIGSSNSHRIQEIHRDWQEKTATRQTAIEAGLIEPKTKEPAMNLKQDPKWAKAKEVCRLNMDDVRKAKELGLSPQALIKNIPSPSQQWKTPVKVWIQELYVKRILSRRELSNDSRSDVNGTAPVAVTDE